MVAMVLILGFFFAVPIVAVAKDLFGD